MILGADDPVWVHRGLFTPLTWKLIEESLDRHARGGVHYPKAYLAELEELRQLAQRHAAPRSRPRTPGIPENPDPVIIGDDELTAKEVATRLQISKRGALGLLERGTLPGRKRGGRWLVQPEVVELFLADRQEATNGSK